MSMPQTTAPPLISLAAVEAAITPGVAVDMTQLLVGDQVPTDPVVTLLDPNNNPVDLPDDPAVSGSQVCQPIRAGTLHPSTTGRLAVYTLIVAFTPSGTSNVLSTVTSIACPY